MKIYTFQLIILKKDAIIIIKYIYYINERHLFT